MTRRLPPLDVFVLLVGAIVCLVATGALLAIREPVFAGFALALGLVLLVRTGLDLRISAREG